MRIYQLEIKNFRGIKDSTFKFATPLVCLIGLGDSTKSTILDAIEYVLSPNWFIPIDDSDFTNCATTDNIEITATIGPIPEELMIDSKFGNYLRGWSIGNSTLNDEPNKDGADVYVVSIRLVINDTLTPEWKVVTHRNPEGSSISYRDRQKCAVSRIGETIDNELAWMRGSSLLRMSNDKKEVEKTLLDANRKLRELDLLTETFQSLKDSVTRAKKSGGLYGINTDNLKPNIDPRNLRGSTGTISLHDGEIPFRRMGLGTRRLMAIGLQLASIEESGAILLIDEVEQALEPHRLKHLLRTLIKKKADVDFGQIFMTTHSPAVLEELGAEGVYCVHYDSEKRESVAEQIKSETQGTIRRVPEAFLSPKVIVCEGQTEVGLLWAFEKHEINRKGDKYSFAYNKTVIVSGEGASSSPERAYHLALNKYSSCLFMDSDKIKKLTEYTERLESTGVKVVRWENPNSTEMQTCKDVALDGLLGIIKLGIKLNGLDENEVLGFLSSSLSSPVSTVDEIKDHVSDEHALRLAVAKAASNHSWFKNIFKAEVLGNYLFGNIYEQIKETVFYKKFDEMQKWAKDEQ